MGTILDRGYVFKKGTALVPTFLAFSVTKLLEKHFGRLVDYDFTALLEDDLDRIADGEENRVDWLSRFYRGTEARNGEPASRAFMRSSPIISRRSTPGTSTRSRSPAPTASSCVSAATARTCSAARSAPASPTTWRPTS